MDAVLQPLLTGVGMFWKALWSLVSGYVISAGIQVLVSLQQMTDMVAARGVKEASLADFFGFISSSRLFAALAASRSVLVG